MGKKLLFILLSTALFINSCDMIEYHPYDGRIKGETDINRKNIKQIEQNCLGKTTFRFAMISDTQRWYDETKDAVNHINARSDIDFVIHGGDLSDFGLTKEFIWMRDILNKLKVPYVCLLGNHDCLGNGEDIFQEIFGDENFAFMAGNTRFICLNTNALEYDYSHPVPDFGFIENELNTIRPEHEKTIVAMHAKPYDEQFNNNVAKAFQLYIKDFPDLQFCIHGHGHAIAINDIFEDGVLYYECANIKKRSYLVFTLKPDGYDYEVVPF